jgi:hypothetical protein
MPSVEHTLQQVVERVYGRYYGKYRGTVADVDDPLEQCRVRAVVPALLGEQQLGWALPAAPFAGDGHGMVMLPEPGSGVWIEFEAGDINHPVWSGAWWAEGQRPEPKGAGVRVIVSKNGHQVVLDDEADELRLKHGAAAGPELVLRGDEIVLTMGQCEIKISATSISLNQGQIKIGLAGVSLVQGAMSFGVPP